MKGWLVAGENRCYWLTRVELLPDGRQTILCTICDGPLDDSLVMLFGSSTGSPGTVACAICGACRNDNDAMPVNDIKEKIESVLRP
jgi:hypothetical protein